MGTRVPVSAVTLWMHIYVDSARIIIIIIIIKNEKIVVTLHVKKVTGALNIVIRNGITVLTDKSLYCSAKCC